MRGKKRNFLLIAMLLFLCACVLEACSREAYSKEGAVVPSDKSTGLDNSTELNNRTGLNGSMVPESSIAPDGASAGANTLPNESASPEPKSDEEEPEADGDEPLTWQSAYLEIICHMEDYLEPYLVRYLIPYEEDIFIDYREDPDFNPDLKKGYVGIHDFDGDGVPELLAGDCIEMCVFTFTDGQVEKIADLYWPDIVWGINGVHFKDNGIRIECDGSTGVWYVCFGFVEGEYRLGRYYEYEDNPEIHGKDLIIEVTLNGEPSTREEMDKIYHTNWNEHDHEAEHKEKVRIINRDGTWVLQYWWSQEEVTLNEDFDFELIRW